MILGTQIIAPATAAGGISNKFDVSSRSKVLYLVPSEGETLTEDDSFELRRVIAESPQRTMPVVDRDGPVKLGANLTQAEVMIRGTYVLKKIAITTESVGVDSSDGFEEVE